MDSIILIKKGGMKDVDYIIYYLFQKNQKNIQCGELKGDYYEKNRIYRSLFGTYYAFL